jgi:hypothetical protein
MIKITLNQIRKHEPCSSGWERLLKFQGKTKADDEEFPFSSLLDSNGLDDALWALCCLDDPKPAQLLAVAFAQEVLDLMEDQRSNNAVKVAHLYLHGEATRKELEEAKWAALAVAGAPWDAARAAAAQISAGLITRTTALAATWAAARTTVCAVDAADRMKEKQSEWIRAIMDNWE